MGGEGTMQTSLHKRGSALQTSYLHKHVLNTCASQRADQFLFAFRKCPLPVLHKQLTCYERTSADKVHNSPCVEGRTLLTSVTGRKSYFFRPKNPKF